MRPMRRCVEDADHEEDVHDHVGAEGERRARRGARHQRQQGQHDVELHLGGEAPPSDAEGPQRVGAGERIEEHQERPRRRPLRGSGVVHQSATRSAR